MDELRDRRARPRWNRIHAPLIEIVWRYGGRDLARSPAGGAAVVGFSFAVAIVGSYLFYLLAERPFFVRRHATGGTRV